MRAASLSRQEPLVIVTLSSNLVIEAAGQQSCGGMVLWYALCFFRRLAWARCACIEAALTDVKWHGDRATKADEIVCMKESPGAMTHRNASLLVRWSIA